jgi:hypothetical protein
LTGASNRQRSGYWYVVDQLHIGPTTAVFITAFDAVLLPGAVELRWQIGSADELRGFNIYRSEEQTPGLIRLNNALIPADEGSTYRDVGVRPGTIYQYQLGAVDRDGEFLSPVVSIEVPPGRVTLDQNHPNPFNPTTIISFYLPSPEHVVLTVYDTRGSRIQTLLADNRDVGTHDVAWNGRNDNGESVSSGVYFYRLKVGKKILTRKMILIQ